MKYHDAVICWRVARFARSGGIPSDTSGKFVLCFHFYKIRSIFRPVFYILVCNQTIWQLIRGCVWCVSWRLSFQYLCRRHRRRDINSQLIICCCHQLVFKSVQIKKGIDEVDSGKPSDLWRRFVMFLFFHSLLLFLYLNSKTREGENYHLLGNEKHTHRYFRLQMHVGKWIVSVPVIKMTAHHTSETITVLKVRLIEFSCCFGLFGLFCRELSNSVHAHQHSLKQSIFYHFA